MQDRLGYNKIKSKVLLLLLIPAAFITILSYMVLKHIYQEYEDLSFTNMQIKRSSNISEIVHYLQLERSLSVEYKEGVKQSELDLDPKEIRSKLKDSAQHAQSLFLEEDLERFADVCQTLIRDDFTLSKDEYSQMIGRLLEFAMNMPSTMADQDNRNLVQAYAYLATNKEALGLLRSTILEAILHGSISKDALKEIIQSYKIYNMSKSIYEGSLQESREFVKHYKQHLGKRDYLDFVSIVQSIIDSSEIDKSLEAREWFYKATALSLRLRELEKELFSFMQHTVLQKQEALNGKIIFIALLLFISLVAFLLAIKYIASRILSLTDKIIEQKNEFAHIAKTDILTGCKNRYGLQLDIYMAQEPHLALLNIDNFRQINDFYGHEFGDGVIKHAASKLQQIFKDHANISIYRLQGDEFVLLCSGCGFEKFRSSVAKTIAQLSEKFVLSGEEILLSWSCGLSSVSKDQLLTSSNMALKYAKLKGKDMVVYSEKISFNAEYENNIIWAKKVSNALKSSSIVPYFQPVIDNKTGDIIKYESLVRLLDQGGVVVSPYTFLDIAKQTRQYFDITKQMIRQSFELFKSRDLACSINLSIVDITDPEMVTYIEHMLRSYGIGERVVFEIVESEYIENFEGARSFIQKVKGFGCKVSIDDFGTGYSNFEYLIKLDVDYLKIDGSLIKNITTDKASYLVVSTIVDFAKKLGIKTVAEFVETKEIYDMLCEMGVDYSQGYYFGAPTPMIEDKGVKGA
ncbi:MAG: EAL domain-containing protein [Sulfuricurvum sp.]